MVKIFDIALVMAFALGMASCAPRENLQNPPAKTGCCFFYDDYRWGSYPWEGKHYNPAEVWDDYHQDFGRYWQRQEGETVQDNR